tara:strand:+ start:2101 stop:2760 length:660 start_codon:yes stop_codon:yes gene_type:complete
MKNLFKILTREESVKTDNLMGVLSPFGEVEVIPDVEGNLEGYTGMCGDLRPEDFETRTTAWDLLFKDLAEEYTWVIEDDVAFNKKTIKSILEALESDKSDLISNKIHSKNKRPRWGWWHLNYRFEDFELLTSLNCFCRISPTLIQKVKQHRDKYGKFMFHEMLFPILSDTKLDFMVTHFREYFNNFHWSESKIDLDSVSEYAVYHPVKSDRRHTDICKL